MWSSNWKPLFLTSLPEIPFPFTLSLSIPFSIGRIFEMIIVMRGWSSAHNFTTVHLKFSFRKCLEYRECLQSPCCLFWQTQSLFALQEGKKRGSKKKKNLCFNPLLSNVRTEKGKFNSHPSGEKQQQVELNWEDNHCLSHVSTGAIKWGFKIYPISLDYLMNCSLRN